MSNSIFINVQIAPPVDGRLTARGTYRVGDNNKSHVQILMTKVPEKVRTWYKPFNSLQSRSQLRKSPRSDWILEKAALKLSGLFIQLALFF